MKRLISLIQFVVCVSVVVVLVTLLGALIVVASSIGSRENKANLIRVQLR